MLPAAGGAVVVLRGPHRGDRAEMLEIDVEKFRARVALRGGAGSAGAERWFEYEDICKAPAG